MSDTAEAKYKIRIKLSEAEAGRCGRRRTMLTAGPGLAGAGRVLCGLLRERGRRAWRVGPAQLRRVLLSYLYFASAVSDIFVINVINNIRIHFIISFYMLCAMIYCSFCCIYV